ncbi:hypothetical protein GOBAR_DD06941 [Gossypium barbadense]|nr:hypothetical protein GOBAR_DD06941 [Gossypium barbadense]
MSTPALNSTMLHPNSRVVGGTENSWCRAVLGGTGIAVLALLISKNPDLSRLRSALHKLQNSHPILRSRLHYNPASNTFSFVTSPSPFIQINSFNHSATSNILENLYGQETQNVTLLHLILEHELNQNSWLASHNPNSPSFSTKNDVLLASVYALPGAKWVVVLRLHAAACDRTTAVSLLRELLTLIGREEEETTPQREEKETMMNKGEVSLAIEDLIPKGKTKKNVLARGIDMLGYSVNSFSFTNLKFKDAKLSRSTQVVKLLINPDDTERILTVRFYHSAVLNPHAIKGGEKLWDLAKKTYTSFANYKKCNKHLSDIADLNFLMCRAMANPGLTSSSSLRTSLISVFEDTVIDESNDQQKLVGVEDYMGCASGHGIASSIAIFDTIRDGWLDCICVYPSPLHSREQMKELVDAMKCILVDAGNNNGTDEIIKP